LNDACRSTFQQLFQFHSGSFQELFIDIRKLLFAQDKVLLVLIEDMSQISAIEDVLIDSLTQEGMRDGEKYLCPVRTAIAVTEGYSGYLRRRDTLATRAKYEWYIEKQSESSERTLNRIINFCGRYLNTARHGKSSLESTYHPSHKQIEWPKI